MLARGLTAADCAHARRLEWRRKVDGALRPGMSPAARKSALEGRRATRRSPRRAGVWAALEELLGGGATHTGRLQMETKSDAEGAARVVLLHARAEVRDTVAGLPLLAMDATMPVEVVRHYLPRLAVLAEIRAAAPHMRVHQVTGGWGKTSLVPNERARPEESRRRANRVAELADFVRLNGGGDALAVTYQAIEPRLAAEGVRTGHFNAVAGLDGYRDVRSLFVVGRPLPDPRGLRALALALTGRPVPAEGGHVETRGALMADGTGRAVDARAYADPDLEALRAAITESEVLQAVGRGRGVNRSAETPLDVFVLADVVVPLPLATLARWEDARPTVVERMAARGCVLLGPTDAARAYPDLFVSPDAARMAIQREAGERDFPNKPLRNTLHREMFGKSLVRVSYRPHGRGQQTRRAWAAPSRLPTLRAWLEGLVGPLAHHVVEGQPPPPPSPTPHEQAVAPPSEAGEPGSAAARDGVPSEPDPDDWRSEFEPDEAVGCGPLPAGVVPAGWPAPTTFFRRGPASGFRHPRRPDPTGAAWVAP